MAADSVVPLRQYVRKSTAAASSPAAADRRSADSPQGRDNPSVGSARKKKVAPDVGPSDRFQNDLDSKSGRDFTAVGTIVNEKSLLPKLETPSGRRTASGLQPVRSHGSRSSIETINSALTPDSFINGEKGCDTLSPSPLCDSNPTSPEEDAISLHDKRTPIDYLRRRSPRRTDDDDQEPLGYGSPMVDVERRKKSSTESRVAPILPTGTSRPSTKLKPLDTRRQRSSSAPSVASHKPKPSSNDPHNLIRDFNKLSIEDKNDAITSPKIRTATSRILEKLAAEQIGRPSSASGRVERRVTNKAETSNATRELADMSDENMEREPTKPISSHTVRSNKCAGLEGNRKARQTNLLAESSTSGVEKLARPNDTQKDSPQRSDSGLSSAVRTPRPTGASLRVKQGGVNDKIENEESVNHRKSSSVNNRSSGILQNNSGSGSDAETDADTVLAANAERRNPYNEGAESDAETNAETVLAPNAVRRDPYDEGAESDGHSELSDLGDSEPETSSELVHRDDARSISDAVPEVLVVPAADGEPRCPDFKRHHRKSQTKSDIQMKLLNIINPKPVKGKVPPRNPARGYIYVYTSAACREEPGTGSMHTYRYFKVGLTIKQTTADRIEQQKDCIPNKIPIEDNKQREFKFARLVDRLIKWDLRNYRRNYLCGSCKKKDGGPTCHNEWYEIEQQHLLSAIEKWRGWITKSNPYNSEGFLRPRWVWKLARLDQGKDGVDLDHVLRPFTFAEKLSRRWDWIEGAWNKFFAQYKDPSRAFMDLFLVIAFIWAIFIHVLGLRLGSSIFVGLSVLILNYLSWR